MHWCWRVGNKSAAPRASSFLTAKTCNNNNNNNNNSNNNGARRGEWCSRRCTRSVTARCNIVERPLRDLNTGVRIGMLDAPSHGRDPAPCSLACLPAFYVDILKKNDIVMVMAPATFPLRLYCTALLHSVNLTLFNLT